MRAFGTGNHPADRRVRPSTAWLLAMVMTATAAGVEREVDPALVVKPLVSARNQGARNDARWVRCFLEGDKTIVEIRSPTGIGAVVLERPSSGWPSALVFRLVLRGLESFSVGTGDMLVQWRVPGGGGKGATVTLRRGQRELGLDADSPFFSRVRLVGGRGKIPLEGGYFEVPLPAALVAANPARLTVRWIDFYR